MLYHQTHCTVGKRLLVTLDKGGYVCGESIVIKANHAYTVE